MPRKDDYPLVSRITNVTVIDPDAGVAHPRRDIILDGGRIAGVEKAACTAPGALDGTGLFAIPGLIDAHVHALGVFSESMPGPLDLTWIFRQQRRNLEAFLRAGVTTVRDMAAPLELIRDYSRRARRFEILSPRILYAGPFLTVRGGYPYFVTKPPLILEALLGPLRVDISSRTHVRRVVDRIARRGGACVKFGFQTATYSDDRAPLPEMPRAFMREICGRAHDAGLPAALHCVYRKDLLRVLDLPFDSLEHLPMDAPLTPGEAERIAAKGVPVSCNSMTYGIIDHVDRLEILLREKPEQFEPKPLEFMKRACRGLRGDKNVSLFIGPRTIETGSLHVRESLARLAAAGARYHLGTDSGGAITPAGAPHWEMIDMKRAGLSDRDALRAATTSAAAAINRPGLGAIKPNNTADIVLLNSNPLKDAPAAIANPATVIRDGRLMIDNR